MNLLLILISRILSAGSSPGINEKKANMPLYSQLIGIPGSSEVCDWNYLMALATAGATVLRAGTAAVDRLE
ncbi:hypothetical protein [Nocardia sp. NPDC004860]|uniref:hypothetical protein n=1 Tax=Nocardia sp. NPDC004860 TaxID=3154557 RepID=UPI00339F4DBD